MEDSTTIQNASLPPSISSSTWAIWGSGRGISSLPQITAGNDDPSRQQNDSWPPHWADNTSPSVSPARLRGAFHDAPQPAADIPRSSSPYTSFPRQAPVGQSTMAQSPPNNIRGGFHESATGFSGGGSLSQAYGPSSRLPSESSYGQFQSRPAQESATHSAVHAPNFVPSSFPATRQRYEDLGNDTRQVEVLAHQLRQMGVEAEDQDRFSSVNRRNNPNPLSQTATNSILPPAFSNQQTQFSDFATYPRQPMTSTAQGPNPWSGAEDSGFAEPYLNVNDGGFQEGNQNNGYYINGNTPQPGMESSRSGVSSHQQGHLNPTPMLLPRDQTFSRTPYGLPYQYQPYNGVRLPVEPYMQPMIQNQPPRRHDDFTHNLRSVLLEEFRSNSKSNKRYELKDIFTHVVEFSGDQHGSRFIQQKLETAHTDEKEIVFNEIRANSLQLMTDVFGNYVIQKFFEHGDQIQKSQLAKQMEGHVLTLSLQMYGCRVVQKALEYILVEQQASLVKELDGHVLKCVKDQNGNHVIQKAIERVPAEHIQFIIKAFNGQVPNLAIHPYGCRVIQRMLEHCDEEAQTSILKELHACNYALCQDQYGNYVTQHVIEHGKPEDRAKIIRLVTTQLLHFSKHKFASNVVEKSIAHATDEERHEIVKTVTALRPDGVSPLHLLMKDQYGNYVIQKLLIQVKDKDREILVDQIKPQLQVLKRHHFGKQINAIEKLIYNSSPPQSQSATPPPSQTPPAAKSALQTAKASSSASGLKLNENNGAPGDSKTAKSSGKPDGASL